MQFYDIEMFDVYYTLFSLARVPVTVTSVSMESNIFW